MACGNYGGSVVFFLVFVIMVALVFLNLFIAVILQSFEETMQTSKKWLDFDKIEHYREVWSKFDPYATGFIRCEDFRKFMFHLEPPLGWDKVFKDDKAW